MNNRRLDADTEQLWDDFHRLVNMSSEELREWLMTDASGETALPADPGSGLPELGARVVELLRKRKVDLTGGDVETMRRVVEHVEERLENHPANRATDPAWRHDLMCVGHDPLKPENALNI
ncbi:DUF3140 domain-containing protein [Actinomadura gamaensis]|uniref:DUF3140 domain-containing protein n=1 Tax=Actinomadura gamaensis TaxID=1763541 RepID=A0ABV9U177_9ACTN